MDKKIFRSMSYGVYVVSTLDGERLTGCTANSIMQITSEPATIAVSMNHDNFTNSCITKSKRFAVSILSEQSEPSLIGNFGFQSGRDADKFEEVEYELVQGLPLIKDSCGGIVCEVIDQMETATHTVFLGKVIDTKAYEGAPGAMTYAYYHNVIKGKSPKNAPTYIAEEETPAKPKETNKYICQVCGYVYEGENLPEDYECPVCKVGADQFEKAE